MTEEGDVFGFSKSGKAIEMATNVCFFGLLEKNVRGRGGGCYLGYVERVWQIGGGSHTELIHMAFA